jgi:hypothetical protein
VGPFESTVLAEYARRLVAEKGKEPRIFKSVLDTRRVKDLIIFLNTENQIMAEGIDTDGRIIGVYSFATEMITDGKKKAGEPFDLHDTGKFLESFRVNVSTGNITITSDPIKQDPLEGTINLFDKFSNHKIEGLTDANLQALIDFVRPLFINEYKTRIIR